MVRPEDIDTRVPATARMTANTGLAEAAGFLDPPPSASTPRQRPRPIRGLRVVGDAAAMTHLAAVALCRHGFLRHRAPVCLHAASPITTDAREPAAAGPAPASARSPAAGTG